MNEITKKYLAWIIVVVAILVAGYLGVTYPIPTPPVGVPQGLSTGGIKCHDPNAAGDCVEVWNGGDIEIYSDQGSTSKFSVDGATGNTTVAGSMTIGGGTINNGIMNQNLAITGTLTVTGTQTLVGATTHSGLVNANAGLAVDTTAFTVADATGNTVVSGTLTVTGTQTLVGNTTASGNVAVTGNVTATTGLAVGSTQFTGAIKYGCATSIVSGGTIAHGIGTTPTAVSLTGYGTTITTTPYISALGTVSITVKFLAEEADAMTVCWMAGR